MSILNEKGLISIIMPCYNASSTLKFVFKSLLDQEEKDLVREIIIIDDASTDDSLGQIEEFSKDTSYKITKILHKQTKGLAYNYNQGIEAVKSDYFILMHQDIILEDCHSFVKILRPLLENQKNIASSPYVLYPRKIWQNYNFWQKCLFSRFVDRRFSSLSGKFNCFNRALLLDRVGLFRNDLYRTAGEDIDMTIRIIEKGFMIVTANLDIIHLHNKDKNFKLINLIKKEGQIAEANGALLRNCGLRKLRFFNVVFFRQVILFLLLVPVVNLIALATIIFYSFYYTKDVFKYEKNSYYLIFLPFINVYLLFVHLFFSVRGYLNGRQIS